MLAYESDMGLHIPCNDELGLSVVILLLLLLSEQ